MKRLLVLGDVHANWPALKAIITYVRHLNFDWVINTGDFTVYSTFPNKTIRWFRKNKKALCIKGNTDRRLLKVYAGKKLKKPRKKEKQVMYHWTATRLSKKNAHYLNSLPNKTTLTLKKSRIGIFHGTYDDPEEALYPNAPIDRFHDLADKADYRLHIMGHAHTPYYKKVRGVHFINPGSVGRMYDGDPRTSFAIVSISSGKVDVEHFRIPYAVEETTAGIDAHQLPGIYKRMFEISRKLN